VYLWSVARLPATVAGCAAAAAGERRAAERHFRAALEQAETLPHQVEQAEGRRFHATMLLDRDGPGDRERAGAMLADARRGYGRIGMPRHDAMVQSLLDGRRY
jgi:hypothetical protein